MLQFESSRHFRSWLTENHAESDGIWLRIFKKGSGKKSISYAEALDEALCHGWIDGQRRPKDARSWIQRFTPRRPRSGWSKINTAHVERLVKAGMMTPAGTKAVEAAKADGRWQAAYSSPRNAAPPGDFLAKLKQDQKASAFFQTLNRANIYAIVYRLQTAKKRETRQRRMRMILEMLAQKRQFHP